MIVKVRLFGVLRECAGSSSVELELPHGALVADALDTLAEREALAQAIARISVAMAVNREYAGPQTVLESDDELALIPPLSGGAHELDRGDGAAGAHVRVTREPLSTDALAELVSRPGAGAVVIFQGVTREVSHLDYEAYQPMAEERMAAIGRACLDRHSLQAAALEHRIGRVALGEASVIVAVSAAHREQAFAGASEAIDRIKAEAPIWKREALADGSSRWVDGIAAPQSRRGTT